MVKISKILLFSNNKGGAGKTTSARNISRALALGGKKVLMVDVDAQANLTSACNIELKPEDPSIAEALLGTEPLPVLRVGEYEYLVPSDTRLSLAGQELANVRDRSARLSNLLDPLKEKFDYIVIDSAPAFDAGCFSAIRAADYVFIPCEAAKFSIDGAAKIATAVKRVQAVKPTLQIAGIVVTRFERTISNTECLKILENLFPGKVLDTKIRRNTALAEASARGMSIFDYAPNSTGAAAYHALTQEIIERMNG